MSAIHGIAWGLVEPEEVVANFKKWRRVVRKEMREHRLRLQPAYGGHYTLSRKSKRGGHLVRTQLAHGCFVTCCEAASKVITPSDQNKSDDATQA